MRKDNRLLFFHMKLFFSSRGRLHEVTTQNRASNFERQSHMEMISETRIFTSNEQTSLITPILSIFDFDSSLSFNGFHLMAFIL